MDFAECTSDACEPAGPARRGILQVHPSLRCNLACRHCYSSSGPRARQELEPHLVCSAISDAAAMGFGVVAVSGGEPLLYRGLVEVLEAAKAAGLFTTVTTNGYLLQPERLERLQGLVDLFAISVDGPPEVHDELRGSPDAFRRLCAGLEHARGSGIPFGFIHTLTRDHWQDLTWVARFAAEQGGRLFQIHPLEIAGRAELTLADRAPDDDVLAKAYVLATALAGLYGEQMVVQIDLLYRDHVREEPEAIYGGPWNHELGCAPAVQALGMMVLESDGAVVPVSSGFSRRFQVCNVKEQRLRDAWPDFFRERYTGFRALCHAVWEDLSAPGAPLVRNWHEVITSRSRARDVDSVRAAEA